MDPFGWVIVGIEAGMQRVDDWLLERRIKRLARELCAVAAKGNVFLLRVVKADYEAAINARSPQQIARMDRRLKASLDPHARAVLDRESRA
jgi:hypothetical protein